MKTTATDVGELSKLTALLTTEQTINALSSKGLTDQQLVQILMNKGIVESEAKAIASKMASSTANGAATFSFKAYTAAIWTNIKAIGAWMLTNPVGWILGLGVALVGTIAILDGFTETIDEQKEKINELKEEYTTLKDELKTLDDQIKENIETINELQAKANNGTITLVEEDQLRKLKLQNELLKQQYKTQQDLEDKKKSKLVSENRETFYNEFDGSVDESADFNFDIQDFYTPGISEYEQASNKNLVLLAKENQKRLENAILLGDENLVELLEDDKNLITEELSSRSDEILLSLLEYQNNLAQAMNEDGTFDNELDQKMWDDLESWKKSIYEYTNSSGEWNSIQIETVLDDNSLREVQNNLAKRLQEGTLSETDISSYGALNDALKNANLILEDGQTSASVYLQYLRGIAVSQAEVNSTVPEFTFSGANSEAIDTYQSQLSTLSNALGQLSSGSMTSTELLDLFQAFPELANKSDNLSSAIQELINNSLAGLKEELSNLGASDDVLALFDNLTSETQNVNLDGILSGLSEMHSSIENLEEEINNTKTISVETLQDISSKYPNLTDAVERYLEGKMDETELLSELRDQYAIDLDNYTEYMINKRQTDVDFYQDLVDNLSTDLKNKAEYYGIDLQEYSNYSALKLGLDAEYAKKRDKMLFTKEVFEKATDKDEPHTFPDYEYEEYRNATEQFTDYDKFVNEFDIAADSIIRDFTPILSFKEDDDDKKKKDKSESETEIDWLTQSLKNLQGIVDKAQSVLENTKGVDAQIEAIDNLNTALSALQQGYRGASKEYNDRYITALSKLPNSKKIQSMIESGEEFDISVYSGDNEKKAKIIQEAIDAYNSKQDADVKVNELGIQIADNENLEKSKVYQTYYESYLDSVNSQLDNQTLTVDEKNALLDEQFETQKKINDELRKQAKYEGDLLAISKYDEEDRKNEKQRDLDKLQNEQEQNQTYIDTYKQLLEDSSLTEDEINGLNKSLKDATDDDFKLRFKEIRLGIDDEVWNTYIQGLKKQYKETKMSDKAFIKKHIGEIASYFDYTGMDQWLSEYFASDEQYDRITYETAKNTRMYTINDNTNRIQDIQNDIDSKNGIGTEKQYTDMIGYYQSNLDIWEDQLIEAQRVLASTTPNTQAWDEANSEVQQLENNINDCDAAIKKCNTSILELPLKEIQDKLEDIADNITQIDKQIAEQDTYIAAANIVLDEQIEFQERQKEIVQDQIDALQKEHDLKESNLNVQKAEYALQKAKNNQVNKVFVEGTGFTYQADADEINDAQHALDEAIYNQKITQLQNQISTYDEEIDRLNDIKENFNSIKSDAEDLLIYNKAIAYDADFVNKVLSSDVALITTFKDTYTELLTNKDIYESEQENYSVLQDTIEDIIQKYQEGSLTYEQAQQQITNTINQYSPGILSSYNLEKSAIEENSQKKLADAEITKKMSEENLENTQKSNEEIIQSYNNLYNNMLEIFGKLNIMMDEFAKETANMTSSISNSISNVTSSLNALSNAKSVLSSVSSSATSGASNFTKLSNEQTSKLVGIGSQLLSNPIGTNLLKIGATNVIPNITTKNSTANNAVSFTGDIVVNSSGDVNALSKDIVSQLPGAMLQTIFKHTT